LRVKDEWLKGITFDILVTTKCNYRCKHCFITDFGRNMSLELFSLLMSDPIFRETSAANRRRVSLSGGEIFFRRDILNLLDLLYGTGISPSCVTNGYFINHEIATRLAELDFSVGLSLDGPKEIHDAYRNYPGAFEKVRKAMAILQEHNVKVGVICSVSRLNVQYIEWVIDFCIRNKVRDLRFQLVKPEGRGVELQKQGLLLDEQEKLLLFDRIVEYSGRYISDIRIRSLGTFKSEIIDHGCKFGLNWGESCHSKSIPWPRSFGVNCVGDILPLHPYHTANFWRVGNIREGLSDVIERYYASDVHIELLNLLKETFEQDILSCPDEVLFEDLFLENRVIERANKR
jgi:MoaA/NifB/PqqE/SkfB family radical SAM enzyme